jgi:shikimate kinase / 3-dehydroquinate synthase
VEAASGVGRADAPEGRAIVFVGFMGAGKTSAARAAAAALGAEAVDSDHALERRLGATIDDYFASHGERAFREAEEELVCELLEAPPSPVLSLGGGAITSSRVRAGLGAHTTVLLDTDTDTAWQRAGGRRPLARDRARFDALHAERSALYEEVADAILPSSNREVVRRALPSIRSLPPGTRLVWAVSDSGQYPVLVGDGARAARVLEGRGIVVSDETVGRLHGPADIVVAPGEEAKTLATAERVLRELARAGLDHDGHVVALGGGVVGDLAGFCAAVYQRGVPVVQVPTTLVAQVDSAYGGKTGVDLPEGKNYVGAYHQPAGVLADPGVLATLAPAERAAGWAEVVKTALIAGGELWRRVRGGTFAPDRELILACARTKLAVVAEDERDAGRRQALNLGHTIGHAIETATAYARYRHGEAVALGLLAALRLSGREELRDEVRELLRAAGLPVELDPAVDLHAVQEAVGRDKKRRAGRVGFVLVEAPGRVRTGCAVEPAEVHAALRELAAT